MKRRRVVITGLGVVAPNGIGKSRFGESLIAGESGIRRVSPAEGLPCEVVARVPDFNLADFARPRGRHSMSRVSQFAVACARMALDDAGLDLATVDPSRTALCYGTTTGRPDFDTGVAKYLEHGLSALEPTAWAEFSPHSPGSHIARELGIAGPITTVSSGCCTGLVAMDWGATQITGGRVDRALVGSGDSLLSPLAIDAFRAGHLLTAQSDPTMAARPYDRRRDGLVPGEAAGVVVLESLESALERDARIYAEYLGYGGAVDLDNGSRRDNGGSGLARAIASALEQARLAATHVDCINAHGLSHPVFDLEETRAFKRALGEAAYCIPVTSIKAATGAAFAADGILQIISSCLILERSLIPPILNLETPDAGCDLDYVRTKARVARVRRILTNTRALGGTNGAVVLGRLER